MSLTLKENSIKINKNTKNFISYKAPKENFSKQERFVEIIISELNMWIYSVRTNKVITNKWIKLAVERFLEDLQRDDLEFRIESLVRVIKFFYYLKLNIKNKYRPFKPLPFQTFMVANLFAIYHKGTDKRKYRYSFFFTARKSGKTTFAAALQLYGLLGDGVQDPQSLLLANSREQAAIALSYATGIINNSPILEKRLETQRYLIKFKDKKKVGYSKIITSNPKRLDGYSPSMCLIDEVHIMENHDTLNVIKSGILARENPLIIIATTAGFSNTSLAADLFQASKKILTKEVVDDSMFALLFTLDDEDDWKDPQNWYKANPALGSILDIEDLKKEFQQAIILPTQRTNFLTKNLNIFSNDGTGWIPNDILLKTIIPKINWEEFKGMDAYLGMDLSSTRDLTSISVSFKKDGKIFTKNIFFLVNVPQKRMRPGGLDLTKWIDKGYIIQCTTPTIDYDLVFEVVKSLKSMYNIKTIYYDRYNQDAIMPRIKKELRIKIEGFAQTTARFNGPLKRWELEIFNNRWFTDNPALIWNINNVILFKDGNGNIKIMKNKSLDSVDGAVSTAMSIGALQDYESKATFNKKVFEN